VRGCRSATVSALSGRSTSRIPVYCTPCTLHSSRKAYVSVRREVLCNILIEFGVPMKLVRLIKMYLNETCKKVRIVKHLSDSFPIQNGLKQAMLYHTCISTLL
jgi:hypothetical protein